MRGGGLLLTAAVLVVLTACGSDEPVDGAEPVDATELPTSTSSAPTTADPLTDDLWRAALVVSLNGRDEPEGCAPALLVGVELFTRLEGGGRIGLGGEPEPGIEPLRSYVEGQSPECLASVEPDALGPDRLPNPQELELVTAMLESDEVIRLATEAGAPIDACIDGHLGPDLLARAGAVDHISDYFLLDLAQAGATLVADFLRYDEALTRCADDLAAEQEPRNEAFLRAVAGTVEPTALAEVLDGLDADDRARLERRACRQLSDLLVEIDRCRRG